MPGIFKMSLEYYIRNLDQLGSKSPCSTPRNAVLDISFSDEQVSINNPGGILVLTDTADGGETSYQNDDLIDAQIISVTRDGLNYTPVDSFNVNPKKEFTDDQEAGEIEFHTGLPPMEPGEDIVIVYIPSGAAIEATEPVTLQQAKDWLRVTHDDEDAIIDALITAARQKCEGYCGKSFVSRTVTAVVRNDLGNIKLPYGPVVSVTNVYDVEGTEYASGDYNVTGIADKRLGYPMSSYVKVVYTAGYTVLPQQFKTAILMQLAWMYVHRGDEEINNIAPDVKAILQPYKSFT